MTSEQPAGQGVRVSPKQVGGGLLVVLALMFVLQNTQSVQVNLLAWDLEWPLWIALILKVAARAFRRSVLKTGTKSGWFARRKTA